MIDPLGSKIQVGSRFVWVSGKGKYGGVKVFTVEKITPKRVGFRETPKSTTLTYADPNSVVIVDVIMDMRNLDSHISILEKI